MSSRYPFLLYVLLFLTALALGWFLVNGSVGGAVFYTSIIFLNFYALFSRYSCKVVVDGSILKVCYFFPWDKDLVVELNEIEFMDFEKGFFDLFSAKTQGGASSFPLYCYDKLILKMRGNELEESLEVLINTRFSSFNKLLFYLA